MRNRSIGLNVVLLCKNCLNSFVVISVCNQKFCSHKCKKLFSLKPKVSK